MSILWRGKPLPQAKLDVPAEERELRLFLDRRIREHKQLMKVVGKWISSDGSTHVKWKGLFEELIAFRTSKGRWPERNVQKTGKALSPQEAKLSAWCNKIRHAGNPDTNNPAKRRHSVRLSTYHVSRLNALGFPWSCAAERWDQRYNELVEYLQNHNGVWPKTVWKKGGVKARSEAEASWHARAVGLSPEAAVQPDWHQSKVCKEKESATYRGYAKSPAGQAVVVRHELGVAEGSSGHRK